MTSKKVLFVFTLAALIAAGRSPNALATPFDVDPDHSTVIFKVKNRDLSYVYGRFNEISGKIEADRPYDPTKLVFKIEIPVKSIDTNNKERDIHLKRSDFFDYKEHPSITFTSKACKELEKGKFEITGDLGLHGVTKELTVIFEQTGSKRVNGAIRFGGQATFTLKRSDFEMANMLENIADEVTVMVNIEAVFPLPPSG